MSDPVRPPRFVGSNADVPLAASGRSRAAHLPHRVDGAAPTPVGPPPPGGPAGASSSQAAFDRLSRIGRIELTPTSWAGERPATLVEQFPDVAEVVSRHLDGFGAYLVGRYGRG